MCGLGHIVARKILENIFIPHPRTDFIDLLSVANMSVFILDQSLHGYYIHGQSPSGKADMNMDELLKTLEEEGQGKVRNRGTIDINIKGLWKKIYKLMRYTYHTI
jgi:meckelin